MTGAIHAYTQRRVALRDIETAETRLRALFIVDGDPGTFKNRVELPKRFTLHELRSIRTMLVITLPDGRKGLEGDR